MPVNKTAIPNADFPEQVGISSYELTPFLNDFRVNKIELHSLMLIRNGKVAFETHSLPYGRYVRQAMFSVGKVFVAAAIGFAQEEGLLSLNSKVIDFFPEYRPPKRDKYLERLTIRHLLTMTAAKKVAPVSPRSAEARLKSFFTAKWTGEPGKTVEYCAENVCICCDILRQVTGTGLTEYLTPRLYGPLGYDTPPQWEKDTTGIEGGYWGIYLSPDELARFSMCLLNKGVYNGKQILPQKFAEEMLTIQSKDIPFQNKKGETDYSYFIRSGNLRHSFMIDGTFSQFAVMAKDYDAILVCTCSHFAPQETRDVIFRHFHRMLVNCKDAPVQEDFSLSLPPVPVICAHRQRETEEDLRGTVLQFRNNAVLSAIGVPCSILPLANIYLAPNKGNNINNMVLDFSADTCLMSWDEGKDHNMIHLAMDGSLRYDKMTISGFDYNIVCAAAWKSERVLEIQVRPLESINERRIILEFGLKKNVTMLSESTTATRMLGDELGNIAAEFFESEGISKPLNSLVSNFSYIINSPIKGKIN